MKTQMNPLTSDEVSEFKAVLNQAPTIITNLTPRRFLRLCRIIYEAIYDVDPGMTDLDLYCRKKMMGPEETAWRHGNVNSTAVMDDAIEFCNGYHFEEIVFGGICHELTPADGGYVMTVENGWSGMYVREAENIVRAVNALARRGVVVIVNRPEQILEVLRHDIV